MNLLDFLKNKGFTITFFVLIFYVLLIAVSDVNKVSNQFLYLKIELVIPIFILETFAYILRSVRQKKFLDFLGVHISLKENFKIFVAGMALIATPGGSGELIKSHFLKKNHGIPISNTAPIVFLERYHDLLAVTIIIAITLLVVLIWQSLLIIIVTSILLVIIFILFNKSKFLLRIQKKVSDIKYLNKIIPGSEFNQTLTKLTKPKIMLQGGLLSLSSWFLSAGSAYFAFLSFGLETEFFEAAQLAFTSILIGVLSFLPGGIIITEGSFIVLLTTKGVDIALASALILLLRMTTIWFATTLGLVMTRFVLKK